MFRVIPFSIFFRPFSTSFMSVKGMSVLLLAISALFTNLTVSQTLTAQAENKPQLPSLSQIHHFEIDPFITPFKTDSNNVQISPELVQNVMFELKNDSRLPKESPAEGLIRLTCNKWPECNEVKMSVFYRPTGDAIWSTTIKTQKFFVTWWFDGIPQPNPKLAKTLVNRLANAYRGF
jgi:hypothetical protein